MNGQTKQPIEPFEQAALIIDALRKEEEMKLAEQEVEEHMFDTYAERDLI